MRLRYSDLALYGNELFPMDYLPFPTEHRQAVYSENEAKSVFPVIEVPEKYEGEASGLGAPVLAQDSLESAHRLAYLA